MERISSLRAALRMAAPCQLAGAGRVKTGNPYIAPHMIAGAVRDEGAVYDRLREGSPKSGARHVWAMPSAPATREPSLFHVSALRASVRIAVGLSVFCAVYFGLQLLRGAF